MHNDFSNPISVFNFDFVFYFFVWTWVFEISWPLFFFPSCLLFVFSLSSSFFLWYMSTSSECMTGAKVLRMQHLRVHIYFFSFIILYFSKWRWPSRVRLSSLLFLFLILSKVQVFFATKKITLNYLILLCILYFFKQIKYL